MCSADLKPLHPRFPPGRADRKALAYTSEIQRLRALGYTFPAIRLALADVGVHVSVTTVKREAARGAAPSHRPAWPSMATSPPSASASGPSASSAATGRQIAEAFFNAHPSNPLLRAKENS